jgi:large repetitive protein
MTTGKVRRLGAAGVVLGCLIALPGPAGAADPPTLSIDDPVAVSEGTGGTTTVVFTVTRTGDLSATTKVTAATSASDPVSATAPDDYGSKMTELSFAAEEASKTFTVDIVTDQIDEFTETFRVTLSGQEGATVSKSVGIGIISDDDEQPSVTEVVDKSVPEGNTGTTTAATVQVTLSRASGKPITIEFVASGGSTATAGSDYTLPSPAVVRFNPGETSKPITVSVIGDTSPEPDEVVFISLFGHVNVSPGPAANLEGRVTIENDDAVQPPTVAPASVDEGNTGTKNLVFSVTIPARGTSVTFNYNTVEGSATASGAQPDYSAASSVGSRTYAPSATPTTDTIAIGILGDSLDEIDETFTLRIFRAGAEVATAVGTIKNDDNNSEIQIEDASADEPQSGTSTLTLNLRLSTASGRAVSVGWQTANGTATAGIDYTAGLGTVDFAPGETTKTIQVTVIGDAVNEENETLFVNLTVTGAKLIDTQGLGTIVDKNAPPSLSISDTTTREGVGADFVVTLAGTTLRTVTVSFNTADGTAQAGSDYSARVGSLTFAPGEKTKTISVTVLDDGAAEFIENFSVSLGDPVNATITKSRGVAVIEASDQPATLQGTTPPTTPPTTPTPPTVPKTQLVPRMILGPRSVSIGANGVARMLVTCQKLSPIGCAGTVELERAARPLLKLGKKTFTVKKGAKGYASIKLSAKTLGLLRKNKTMRAKVIVLVKTSTKTLRVSPGIITLKATQALIKSKPKPPPTKVVVNP